MHICVIRPQWVNVHSQYIGTGADNSLLPNQWQVITWINDEQILWCHTVPLDHNKLIHSIVTSCYENILLTIHPSTKSPPGGVSTSCCQAQSNILSKMAVLPGQASEWHWSGGSAPNLFLVISLITVVLSIWRSYITEGNQTFIIP